MQPVEQIADFVISTEYKDLSEKSIETIKRCFLDSLGVMIAGAGTDIHKVLESYSTKYLGKGTIGIPNTSLSLLPQDAAFYFGVLLHALDYDDTGAFTQGHPSAPVFPVIYTLINSEAISGEEAIVAYAIGIEVLSRLSRSMPMLHLKGWHPTGVLGPVVAAVTAAKLLRLNKEEMIHAIGIACSQAAGLVQNFGTMTKPFHAGNATSNGLRAALLAKEGLTASKDALNGNLGFLKTYFSGDDTKENEFLLDFGQPLVVDTPGINYKRYASCALTHRSIDGAMELAEQHQIAAESIDSVICETSPRALKVLFYTNPQAELEAKFSMQYVLAAALKYKDVGPKQFNEQNIKDPGLRELMSKIIVKVHDDWTDGDDWRADKVTIRLLDGTEYTTLIQFPKGNAAKPLTWAELEDKFRNCVNGALNETAVQQVIETIKAMPGYTRLDFKSLTEH